MTNVLKISVALLVLSALSFATPVPPAACVDGSLATYIALGSAGCSVGDKIFYNFDFNLFKIYDIVTPPDASGISIKPDQAGNTMILDFTGTPFAALRGGLADFGIWYTVKTASGDPLIRLGTLTASGGARLDGFASISENVCVGQDLYGAGCATPGQMYVEISSTLSGGVDNVVFAPPYVSKVAVYKDIIVSAGTGSVGFSQMTQSWTQVPEPGAAFALLLGLSGVGYAVRRRRVV
jgi:hypothetical protein